METVTIPGPMRIMTASAGAWWIADFINPGFHAIAIMTLLMIPILTWEFYLILPIATVEPVSAPLPPVDEEEDQENSV